MQGLPHQPISETTICESRGADRVYGMECSVGLVRGWEAIEVPVLIENESPGGMAIQMADAHDFEMDAIVVVNDFDGEKLGIVRHVTPNDAGYVVGIQWQ